MKQTTGVMASMAAVLAMFGFAGPIQAESRQVIRAVSVLTMDGPGLLRDQAVVIESGRVSELLPDALYSAEPGDRVIAGEGGVLMPGLIDTHVHIDHPQDVALYPLYGVTTVLNMRGLPWHLMLREEIRAQRTVGPDFLTSGDYLDGSPPAMLPMSSVADVPSAQALVSRMQQSGFDMIKVYSELSREQYVAICDRARDLGMAVVGHLPDAAEISDVLDCPHRNVAHGEQLFKLLNNRQDSTEVAALLKRLAASGITVTANINLHAEMARQPTELEALVSRPEVQLLHPATFQPWRPGVNRYARRDQDWVQRVRQVIQDLGQLIWVAESRGHDLLVAGSDSPVAGALPGDSLIAEVEAYRRAGLANLEALRTATVSAGRLLRTLDAEFPLVGVVRPGARADLLLLGSNPLDDLTALRDARGVMLRGRWLDRSQLDGISERLRATNAAVDPQVRALEGAVFSGDMERASALFQEFRHEAPDATLFSQYPFFFFGFQWLYDEDGLSNDANKAAKAAILYDMYRQTYPEFHVSHHVYGLALEAVGDRNAALEAQRLALSLLPEFPPALEAVRRLRQQQLSTRQIPE